MSEKGSVEPRKLTILFVSFTFLDMALHRTALLQIVKKLSELNHNLKLVALRSKLKQDFSNPRLQVTSLPIRNMPLISIIIFSVITSIYLPLYLLFTKKKPDFIIFDPDVHILSFFPISLVNRLKKTKIVLDIRTVIVEDKGIRGVLRRFWFTVSILVAKKKFDGLTIITDSMRKKICGDYSLNAAAMGVWTSGVCENLFNPNKHRTKGSELRARHGLTDKFIVFYHGIFTPSRGLAETIKALKILTTKYPNITVFLLGTGPMVATLNELIKREGLQNNVTIAGPVDQVEVPKFISMCDVGIVPLPDHPYWRFQSPLKLLEYLAMEKVVVLTDITAHRSVIGDAKCGVYLASIDPEEIAAAIEYTYLNRASLVEWGKVGRAIVENKFTWGRVASDLEDYLLKIKKG